MYAVGHLRQCDIRKTYFHVYTYPAPWSSLPDHRLFVEREDEFEEGQELPLNQPSRFRNMTAQI